MRLYIARHGYAGDPVDDPKQERDRPLLPEGKATVTAMAKAMAALGEIPKVIFCSPFARTIMSADLFGKILGVQVNVIGEFAPMRPLEDSIVGLISKDRIKRVMVVGHVDNTTPAMDTLGGDVKWKDLVMAEVRRVDMNRDDGGWKLKWGMKPSDIGCRDRKS